MLDKQSPTTPHPQPLLYYFLFGDGAQYIGSVLVFVVCCELLERHCQGQTTTPEFITDNINEMLTW